MTREIVSATVDSSLAEVVAFMEVRRIKRLLVLEQGQRVGIVNHADLLRALEQLLPRESVAAVSDAQTRRRVLAAIDKQSWVPRACIDPKVGNGVVEFRGNVLDGRERDALRVVVENTPGVSGIRDHLVWIEPVSGAHVEGPTDDRSFPFQLASAAVVAEHEVVSLSVSLPAGRRVLLGARRTLHTPGRNAMIDTPSATARPSI